MLNNIKATLLRMSELSWESLTKLKAWMKMSASFNSFDGENFNSPSLKIAQASDANGTPVVFCPVETCFLVSAYAVSPNVTPLEAQHAGDVIDAEIARHAQRNGISKMLIVVPKDYPALQDGEWKEFRVYERRIATAFNTHAINTTPQGLSQVVN
jgi:hypothetical protein